MMKKIASLLVLIAMVINIVPTTYASTENELISKLQSTTNDTIVKTFYEDFSGDGVYELFAFTGKLIESDGYYPSMLQGKMWYVSDSKVELVDDNSTRGGLGTVMDGSYMPSAVQQNGNTILIYQHMWGNGELATTIFTVTEGNPDITDYDGYLTVSNDEYLMQNTAYDNYISKENIDNGLYFGTGRTWKNYWYYWDDNEMKLKEYGAVPISTQQFLEFNGAQDILNLITEGEIYNILYRANGIININIISGNNAEEDYECSNILVGYDDNSVWTIDDQHSDASADYRSPIHSGLYLPALNEEIAVFPDLENNSTETPIKVVLNGTELSFDQPPIMENDRVMVPMRAIFEALGYTVDWYGDTQTAVANKGNNTITVQINNNKIFYNRGTYSCDVSPKIVSERTLVPVRAISECDGCNVDWDGETKTVIIASE